MACRGQSIDLVQVDQDLLNDQPDSVNCTLGPEGSCTKLDSDHNPSRSPRVTITAQQSLSDFDKCYTLGVVLGVGSFAEVRVAQCITTGLQFAAKINKNPAATLPSGAGFAVEGEVLRRAQGHRGVVLLRDVCLRPAAPDWNAPPTTTVCLVLELLKGPCLLDYVNSRSYLCEESEVKALVRQMLSTLAHLHALGIMHRDVALQNFVFRGKIIPAAERDAAIDNNSELVLVDFGFASTNEREHQLCGTGPYIAPEMLSACNGKPGYTSQCDMWSLGVVVYALVFRRPFNRQAHLAQLTEGEFQFPSSWSTPSAKMCQSFLHGLLKCNPLSRLSAAEAITHPWLRDERLLCTSPCGEDDLLPSSATR